MTDHTPEPWQGSGAILTPEDWERAKACVNACAGIPTEQLEAGIVLRLCDTLDGISYECGQYADGAEDAHYLAQEMANLEGRANAALAPFRKD